MLTIKYQSKSTSMKLTSLLLLCSVCSLATGFTLPTSIRTNTNSIAYTNICTNLLAKGKLETPQNEFSRPIKVDNVLGQRKRDYNIEISAKEEELEGLAKRFSLSNIQKLSADLSLCRDNMDRGADSVLVKGEIFATVTQTCVRTNEDFEVDLEFEMFSVVKAFGVRSDYDDDLGGLTQADLEGALNAGGGSNRRKKQKKRGRKNDVNMKDGGTLDDMRMKEIEDLLQEFDLEEDIIEDENIFGLDGVLDIGELIAQTFRLKLDPYPKKPGSEPVSYSITG